MINRTHKRKIIIFLFVLCILLISFIFLCSCNKNDSKFKYYKDGELFDLVQGYDFPNQEKDGYTFYGYSTSFSAIDLDDGTILYPVWYKETSFFVWKSFHSNEDNRVPTSREYLIEGKKGETNIINADLEQSMVLPSNPCFGYSFEGYYDEETGGIKYADENGYIASIADCTGETLYPRMTIKKYTLKYYIDDDLIHFSDFVYGSKINSVPFPSEAEKDGYDFIGWQVSGENYIISVEDNINNPPALNSDTLLAEAAKRNDSGTVIRLDAIIRIKTFKVTFNLNYGNSIVTKIFDYTFGTAINESFSPPAGRSYYDFEEWTYDSKGEIPINYPIIITEDMTVYAKWSLSDITVSFDLNSGITAENTDNIVLKYGEELTTLPFGVSKTYYNFVGWFSGNEEEAIQYTTATALLAEKRFINEDNFRIINNEIKFYARFEHIRYTITFDLQQNGYEPYIVEINAGEPLSDKQPDLSAIRALQLVKWVDESETEATIATNSMTVYAVWIPRKYTLIFDSKCETTIPPEEIDANSAITAPDIELIKEHYTFDYWCEAGTLTPYSFDKMPVRNLKLYARWMPILKTVTFELNGGSGIQQTSVLEGSTLNTPEEPTKVGNIFYGWYSDEPLTSPFSFMTAISNDIMLYAKWQADDSSIGIDSFNALRLAIEADPYGTYYLENDLVVGDIFLSSLGDFYGILDGNGYEISNFQMRSSGGLFSVNEGVIRNLVISDFLIFPMRSYGISVGALAVTNKGTISNVRVADFTIRLIGDYNSIEVGGISAVNEGRILNCLLQEGNMALRNELENSSSNGIINYVGGAVGKNTSILSDITANLSIEIDYSVSSDYTTTKNLYVGGIVGKNETLVLSKNFKTEGNMSVTIGDSMGAYESQDRRSYTCTTYAYIGGIIGLGTSGSYSNIISDMETVVYNYSTITDGGFATAILEKNIYVGGIIGKLQDADLTFCSSKNSVMIKTNDRKDEINDWIENPNNIYCGGIVGEAASATITNCSSTGLVQHDIIGEYGTDHLGAYGSLINVVPANTKSNCGGIAGQMTNASLINSYSESDISSTRKDYQRSASFNIGGISGYIQDSVIDCCYSAGSIEYKVAGNLVDDAGYEGFLIGGIAGNLTSESEINKCFTASSNKITANGEITDNIKEAFALDTHTTSQFKSLEWLFYELCWDGEIWIADEGVSYPKLYF